MTDSDEVPNDRDARRQGAPLLAIFLLLSVLALLMASGFTGEAFREGDGDKTAMLPQLAAAVSIIAVPGIATGLVLGLLSKRKKVAVPAGMALGLVFGMMCGLAIVSGGNLWLLVVGIPIILGVALVGRLRSDRKMDASTSA